MINNVAVHLNPDDQAIKYLGVFLGKKVNWNFHENIKFKQGYASLALFYSIGHLV